MSVIGMGEHPIIRPVYQLSEREVAPFAEPAARVLKKYGGKHVKQLENFADVFALIAGANVLYQTISAKKEATLADIAKYASEGHAEALDVVAFYDAKKRRKQQPRPASVPNTASDAGSRERNGTERTYTDDRDNLLRSANL